MWRAKQGWCLGQTWHLTINVHLLLPSRSGGYPKVPALAFHVTVPCVFQKLPSFGSSSVFLRQHSLLSDPSPCPLKTQGLSGNPQALLPRPTFPFMAWPHAMACHVLVIVLSLHSGLGRAAGRWQSHDQLLGDQPCLPVVPLCPGAAV